MLRERLSDPEGFAAVLEELGGIAVILPRH